MIGFDLKESKRQTETETETQREREQSRLLPDVATWHGRMARPA